MFNMFDPASLAPHVDNLRAELVSRLQERLGLDKDTAERVSEEAVQLAKERAPEVIQSVLASTGLGNLFGGR